MLADTGSGNQEIQVHTSMREMHLSHCKGPVVHALLVRSNMHEIRVSVRVRSQTESRKKCNEYK